MRVMLLAAVMFAGCAFKTPKETVGKIESVEQSEDIPDHEKELGILEKITHLPEDTYSYSSQELTIETVKYASDSGDNKTIKVASCRGCHWRCRE